MQTLHLNGLKNLLQGNARSKTITERITENLAKSNLGLNRNTSSQTTVCDSFSITQNISELLSPACGMTEEEKQSYLSKIQAKLKSGKKLTSEEMRFLQAENPTLYQQAARVQAMRESLELRLKHSTSKQNANAIYTDALSMVSKDDPMKEYLIAAYDDAMKEFKKTDEYQSLPETDKDAEKK